MNFMNSNTTYPELLRFLSNSADSNLRDVADKLERLGVTDGSIKPKKVELSDIKSASLYWSGVVAEVYTLVDDLDNWIKYEDVSKDIAELYRLDGFNESTNPFNHDITLHRNKGATSWELSIRCGVVFSDREGNKDVEMYIQSHGEDELKYRIDPIGNNKNLSAQKAMKMASKYIIDAAGKMLLQVG